MNDSSHGTVYPSGGYSLSDQNFWSEIAIFDIDGGW